MNEQLESLFPQLHGASYEITSPATPDYNCIAWAAIDDSRWWEPDGFGLYYWPESAPRQYTLEAYAEAFRWLGFERSGDPTFEQGWEKVAIFADKDGKPTHAARELTNGKWTSKLGTLEDIMHPELEHVSGEHYGKPVLILRRRTGGPTSLPTEANP